MQTSTKPCSQVPCSLDQVTGAQLYREYIYSVVVYKEYLTRLGELIIFEPLRENYHFSQQS